MPYQTLELPDDPTEALKMILETSQKTPVLIFKKSPVCPVSTYAESEFNQWLETLSVDAEVAVGVIDVIAQRPLARGLTRELDIPHASPQALFFTRGALKWHDSHHLLTLDRFREGLSPPEIRD